MPRPTNSEIITDLQTSLTTLRAELAATRNELERARVLELRESLARLESRSDRADRDLAKLAELQASVARLDERVAELKRLKEEADRRYYQFVLLFFGGLITLAINVAITFLKK